MANPEANVSSPASHSLHTTMPEVAETARNGRVLLVGGTSGSGKTTAAKQLIRRTNATWIQVDDVRLAFQWSGVRLPNDDETCSLHAFEQPEIWAQPAQTLRNHMIRVGEALADAIAIITANHVAQDDSAIIEGDGILPSIVDHPQIRPLITSDLVNIVFVLPETPDEILHRLRDRGRDSTPGDSDSLSRKAEMHWHYTTWLREQATDRSLPILTPSPLETLTDRIQNIWPFAPTGNWEDRA